MGNTQNKSTPNFTSPVKGEDFLNQASAAQEHNDISLEITYTQILEEQS